MADQKDLLLEIGTEDLPAKSIKPILEALKKNVIQGLEKAQLHHGELHAYATPRRLAIKIDNLVVEQPTQQIERKGPALAAAFDKEGNPTPACLGFAKSCGVTVEQLIKQETPQGTWLYFSQEQAGKLTNELLPEIIINACKKLPIPKPMRWGNSKIEFIRPVKWVVLLFGDELINTEILGKKTQRETYGHRFHHPDAITIQNPNDYLALLSNAKVLANPEERTQKIIAASSAWKILTGPEYNRLLEEVTNLVEWPVALEGKFDESFLQLPEEVIITAMHTHQRYFPVISDTNKLAAKFVLISNIESMDEQRVIAGNERVLRARLSDAMFFYQSDLKQPLYEQRRKLKTVLFQQKLGSLFDKTERLANLASFIAEKLNIDLQIARYAAEICKTDLMTEMVGEFPELQGVMGYYYALASKEKPEIAQAIKEHYYPRFAGDQLPDSLLGCIIALADRIDTLIGIFGINQAPTGEKDPFALRRAALGILRILIEKQLPIDLTELLQHAINNYENKLTNKNTGAEALVFIMERLRAWYAEQQIKSEVFNAVYARCNSNPWDFSQRINAVMNFIQLPEAAALTAANKRVSNILKKEIIAEINHDINAQWLEHPSEKTLHDLIVNKESIVAEHQKQGQYKEILYTLAELQQAIDDFFDNVMVMAENENLRKNRLALLTHLRRLFLNVADISHL